MEFRLDDDQIDLQQTVARFFEDRYPLDAIHEREGGAVDRVAWRALADLGIFGLLVDPADGGSGLGVVEAALVFEQIGSHLVPGPLMWSTLAATVIDADRRAAVIDGSTVVAGVDLSAPSETGTDVGSGSTLTTGTPVESVVDADLVLAVGPDAVTVLERDALERDGLGPVQPLDSLDPLTSVAAVASLAGGAGLGEPGLGGTDLGGRDVADRLRLVGSVLVAAELVGVAGRALEVARSYALEREQFGVPIGSFQAVKHMLADMYVRVTVAQSATYAAAAVVDRPGPGDDPVRSVDAAVLLATEAAIDGASDAVQILGGMGFTWDMLPNYLLKRAWHLSLRFEAGDARAQAAGRALVGA